LAQADWLAAFDAALLALSPDRPLSEVLADVLEQAARALGAGDGFVLLAPAEGAGTRVGLGAWAEVSPEQLDARCLAVPVGLGTQLLGHLGLGRGNDAPAFEAGAAAALAPFASLAAIAHENHRHLNVERAALAQAEALRGATRALSASLSLRDVLHAILSELGNVVPYDTASVQQLQGDRMVIIGGHGIDLDHFLGIGFDAIKGCVPNRDVFTTRAPVIVPDILAPHPYSDFPSVAHALSGVRSWLGVPLLFGERCVGMITMDKLDANFYTEQHAQAALAFAAQAAIALENARLYEQSHLELQERRKAESELREMNRRLQSQIAEVQALQGRLKEQAIRDPLTGLFNRRYLTETLQRELARSDRDGRPLSVVMLDVDHFKELNDSAGHDAGDRMLQAIGHYLGEQTREGDVACRFGGEEFVVVLPGAAARMAAERAEDWRAAFEALRLAYEGRELRVTISMGVADFPAHARGLEDLLRVADVALYEAKRAGRNKVVIAR